MSDFDPRRDAVADAAALSTPPRDLVDRPDMFGRWGKPMRAADGIDASDARFVAANLQHWVANAVREEVLMLRTNLATLLPTFATTSSDFTLDRLSALQHGDAPMRLDDLLVLSRRFDSVRDILVSAFGDASRPAVATKPPAEGGMGPVLTTRRGRASEESQRSPPLTARRARAREGCHVSARTRAAGMPRLTASAAQSPRAPGRPVGREC